ncbi:phosphotransferase [Glycomyces sp. TRM65418]|uniref:phosphotransferase family protein n=1 Tax=Glycomyces sp. TRM65418 TaxID=2867006 RepID=UPI001CE64A86|nr:phosphotransferase [Glycomyces sp. TRM65418]MCC3765055.1 phosphotransferase [Glycomyces sp. TRM65418]QZD54685.1 phosphotransferase [Glycomyces sp. TRM65418]
MKTALTDEEVAEAMRARLGPVSRWERLPGGEMSQAFAFRADGRDLVVRVGPRREGFDKDAWAARRFRDTAVPVPEVLEVGGLGAGVYCCVSERLGGVHLTGCDEAEQRRTAPAVRAVADAIAEVDLSGSTGFGSFDPETEQGPHPTWAAHLRSLLPDPWDLDDPADTALTEDLASIADDIALSLPEVRRLVHGDLNAGNFTVADGAVVGVFDWEAAVIGDPLWEAARNLLWAPVMPIARIQAEYDLDRLSAEPNLSERLRCLVIVNGLWAVEFYRQAAHTPAMELMLNRLHGFRDDPLPLDTGRDAYWMRLLPPGARRA